MATLNFPDNPTTGDVYTDSNSGFSYEWNGTVWISTDPSTASNIRELDDISSGFDNTETDFALRVSGESVEPVNAQQLIISLGGVMQNAGDDFTVSGSTITFTTAPQSSLSFFGTLLGTALSLNTIADGTVLPTSLSTTSNYLMNGLTLDQGAGIITAFAFQGGSVATDLDSSFGADVTFAANVSIGGSLTVQGTQTIINVDELNIQDKTIGIGSTNAPSSASQDGSGAIIYGQTHIDILYDRDTASLGISTAVTVTGVVTATNITANDSSKPSLSLHTGSTLRADLSANSGITSIRSHANSPFSINVGGSGETEALRITSAGKVGIGTDASLTHILTVNDTNPKISMRDGGAERAFLHVDGSDDFIINNKSISNLIFKTQDAERLRITSDGDVGIGTYGDSTYRTHIKNDTYGVLKLETDLTGGDGAYLDLYHNSASPADDDNLGSIGFKGKNSADEETDYARISGYSGDVTDGTEDGYFTINTKSAGTMGERLRITSGGGFSFNNAQLIERVAIVAGKLSNNTNINLADGMVYYFSTTETGTSTPNIRIDGSNTLNNAMDTGDVISVTLITTAAAAAYSAALNIDGSSATVEWSGATAPAAGGASGLDVYAYTIIKIGSGSYKVLGNYTNFD